MGKIVIDEKKCKGCGLCISACPRHLIVMSDKFNENGYHPAQFSYQGDCSGCGLCFQICPEVAIEVWK